MLQHPLQANFSAFEENHMKRDQQAFTTERLKPPVATPHKVDSSSPAVPVSSMKAHMESSSPVKLNSVSHTAAVSPCEGGSTAATPIPAPDEDGKGDLLACSGCTKVGAEALLAQESHCERKLSRESEMPTTHTKNVTEEDAGGATQKDSLRDGVLCVVKTTGNSTRANAFCKEAAKSVSDAFPRSGDIAEKSSMTESLSLNASGNDPENQSPRKNCKFEELTTGTSRTLSEKTGKCEKKTVSQLLAGSPIDMETETSAELDISCSSSGTSTSRLIVGKDRYIGKNNGTFSSPQESLSSSRSNFTYSPQRLLGVKRRILDAETRRLNEEVDEHFRQAEEVLSNRWFLSERYNGGSSPPGPDTNGGKPRRWSSGAQHRDSVYISSLQAFSNSPRTPVSLESALKLSSLSLPVYWLYQHPFH